MASTLLPYLGLDEVMDKTRTLKAIIAEFTGTLFLVREVTRPKKKLTYDADQDCEHRDSHVE